MLCFSEKQSTNMASLTIFTLSCLFSVLPFSKFTEAAGLIGVNYGRVANDLPQPAKVVELLKSNGINRVKLYDTDSEVLTALANSGISVVVALPNELLSSTATDQTFADNWVQANISKYYPSTMIEVIAVGNEVFADSKSTQFLVPAMKNVYSSLEKYNLSSIKLSSPIALSALQNSYPSSAGSFKSDLIEPVLKPMFEFLRQTGSYLMVNAYPFFAYSANSDKISLDYALFKENPGVVDSGNGLKYTTLFEAQLDAVFAAMKAVQYDDVKVVVSETGWPSKGDENEIGAGQENAASYNGNLIRRVLTGSGTPLRPQDPLNVYLFALFNENQKTGPTSEKNYGLFYPNEEKVYSVPFTQEELENGQSTPAANGSKSQVPAPPAGDMSKSSVGQTWCVANSQVGEKKLQAGLDYACGEGGADCSPIQSGSDCYQPNTLEAHASYAFNSYYQKMARGAGTCDFGGAAFVVAQAPKYGNCDFPTRY
ncbi:O-Glycosyl hydrolases family 17 protein [Tripterygium wilfordii]|uniref:glucan endo-1,3-beta-D-glucosidase n=1 Tax=Tripterygium wilfordii TaxID=458696 RepID=A0A7J7C3T2_TRIWF|nr:glucan endo-1,3-beta-glucosidase 14 [Tripterygium wilfordii]KAF5728426.1 O-Glycosyl hydrolases family 17 protein [Tripterygium wilfordii]